MSKLNIWKCPKCKSFNEDYYDECDCGYSNRFEKKKIEGKKEEIENFYFSDQEQFDGFY